MKAVLQALASGLKLSWMQTSRTSGSYVRAGPAAPTYRCVFGDVGTARNYGPYVRVVCTDHPYVRAVRPAQTKKASSCNAFCSYGPYVQVVCTELPYVPAVKPSLLILSRIIKFTYLLQH